MKTKIYTILAGSCVLSKLVILHIMDVLRSASIATYLETLMGFLKVGGGLFIFLAGGESGLSLFYWEQDEEQRSI